MPATLGLSKRSPRRFLEVGNGKETPEKTQISRFYTAWAKSGRSSTFFIGCAMSSVKIYDVVKIKKLYKPIDFQPDGTSIRAPIVGDLAAVVEVYTTPLGFELECSGKDGITIWLQAFAPEEVELEVVG